MKNQLYLCLLFSCLCFLCNAQKSRDYLLTLQKDTLFGEILMKEGQDPITFIHDKEKIIFHPSTIQSFGVFEKNQYQHFKTLRSKGGKNIFVRIMVAGKVNLYKYTEEHIFSHSILRRYVYFMGTSDTELVTLSSSSYQRTLTSFFENYPRLLAQLANYSYDEVPKIVEQYNTN